MQAQEFEEKVFSLKDRLFRFSLVLLKNREEAEDVVQEVLTKLWSMRGKLNKVNSIEAYAIQMVRHDCINRMKSKSRAWTSIENISERMSDQQPEQSFLRKEMFQNLFSFISGLPEQQQLVIMLRDIEGLEMSEIGSITNMTANNICVTLSLARKKIAELYKAHEAYERK